MNAIIEASSGIVVSESFPLCTWFSFDEATVGPLTVTGAELEFSTLVAYSVQSRVTCDNFC